MRRLSIRDDRGETLVELLVTIVIMSTAVIALVAAIAASIRISDVHRKEATAGSFVRAFAEAVENKVAGTPTGYTNCATTTAYQPAYTVPDAKYTASITAVSYWNGTAFVTACPAGGDMGVQRVELTVQSNDARASETVTVIIRKPCRSAIDFPLDPPCTT